MHCGSLAHMARMAHTVARMACWLAWLAGLHISETQCATLKKKF